MLRDDATAGPRSPTTAASALSLRAFLFLVIVGLLVYPLRAQEASRMALTASVAEQGSVVIDGYPLGIDRAERDGRTYSDKAPGQPVLAVPAYALTQALGMTDAREQVIDENLTLWMVTFVSATLAALVLVPLGRRMAQSEGKGAATWAAVALVTGTILLPLSTVLFGHVLAALLIVGAFVLLQGEQPRPALAGLLAGLSVTVEYTAAIGVIVLGGWLAWRTFSKIGWFLAGGVLPAVGLGIYNAIAFGSPLSFSYQYSAFGGTPVDAEPLFGMFQAPTLENLVLLFVSGRGLLVATPVIVVAVIGTVWLAQEPRTRDLGLVCLTVFVGFLLLPIFWSNPFGGDSPGPRYLTPALIFLAPGLARFWKRRRILAVGVWLLSVLTMALATFTDALALTRNDPAGLSGWLPMAVAGEWMPNLLGVLGGTPGNVVFVVLAATSTVLLVHGMTRTHPIRDGAG